MILIAVWFLTVAIFGSIMCCRMGARAFLLALELVPAQVEPRGDEPE